MTSTLSDALLAEHPAFRDLAPARLEQLAVQFQLRRFAVGQPLCHRSLVPGEVLLILEGEARLLVEEQGRPATLAKLGPGDWVGLASFLRVKGCEEVAAARAGPRLPPACPQVPVTAVRAAGPPVRHPLVLPALPALRPEPPVRCPRATPAQQG